MNEKTHDKELKRLKALQNNIVSTWNFTPTKNFETLLKKVGIPTTGYFPSELYRVLSISDVVEFFSDRRIELQTRQWLELNPPQIANDSSEDTSSIIQSCLPAELPTELVPPVTEQLEIENNIPELSECPLQTCTLYWHQKKAAASILDKIINHTYKGLLITAGAGLGKTFIFGAVLCRLKEYLKDCNSLFPIVIVTKARAVTQTIRVMEKYFGLRNNHDLIVINIDALRSKAGELFIKEQMIVVEGKEITKYIWRKGIKPKVIVWDECQVLNNDTSIQHHIGVAANDCEPGDEIIQLFVSATPFYKVKQTKAFTLACRTTFNNGWTDCLIDKDNFMQFAKQISDPYLPHEYAPAAIDRYRDYMDKFVVPIKGVKTQFKAVNKVLTLEFKTAEGTAYYDEAVVRFQKKKAKLESKKACGEISEGKAKMGLLTALLQYRIAAESNPDRIDFLCHQAYENVMQCNKAVIVGCSFRTTIAKCVTKLVKEYGVSRDLISIIWGGGSSEPTKKQKLKAKIQEKSDLQIALEEAGITLEDLDLEDVDAVKDAPVYEPELRLGTPSKAETQREIDRFQSGKTLYCFFVLKSGGVALSLHHTDEFTEHKVRHKKDSNYAYEEDIPLVETRPRISFFTPTWSPTELVQAVGRGPRINSLSDTEQYLIFFKDTVEEKVARIVGKGLLCLTKVLRQKEPWEDIIITGMTDEEIESKMLSNLEPSQEEEQLLSTSIVDEDKDDS